MLSVHSPRPLLEIQIRPVGGKKNELMLVADSLLLMRFHVRPPSLECTMPLCIVPMSTVHGLYGSHATTVASDASPMVKMNRPESVTAFVSSGNGNHVVPPSTENFISLSRTSGAMR